METLFGIDYPSLWFIVVSILFAGYAVLDGFDFGAGAWHLGLRTDEHRRISLNAIGPIWDGNEVWLVIGGGALFAGFPLMYASFFSALYIPFMLFLVVIIFRAVSIEFRSKEAMKWWTNTWDISYSVSSILLAFLLGVVLGNILQGISLGENFEYEGGALFDFLNPYALLIGLSNLTLCMTHGALFMLTKTEGEVHKKFTRWVWIGFALFFIFFSISNIYTHTSFPHLSDTFTNNPILFIFPIFALSAIILSAKLTHTKKYSKAFFSSSIFIILLITTIAIELYPTLLQSTISEEHTITIYNAASSDKTIGIMLLMVAIGFPLLIAYTVFAYKIFSGKVKLDEHSY